MTLAMTAALPVLRGPVAAGEGARRDRPAVRRPLVAAHRAGVVAARLRGGRASRSRSAGRGFDAALVDCAKLLRELEPARPAFRCGWRAGARRPGFGGWPRRGDGWLASAYNTTPERFARGAASSCRTAIPNALATMWTWVTDDRRSRARAARRARAAAAARPGRAARTCRASARPSTAPSCSRATPGRLPARLRLAAGRRARQLERIASEVSRRSPASARAACARLSTIAVTAGPR